MKKILLIITLLCFNLFLFADLDFSDNTLLVTLTPSYSEYAGNRDASFFGSFEKISVENISQIHNQAAIDVLNKRNPGEFRSIYKITLPTNDKAKVLAAIEELKRIPVIESATPNYITTADLIPDDTYWDHPGLWSLWGTHGIKAPEAWDITIGSHNIRVGISDTGIASHPDLNANLDASTGWNFWSNNSNTTDTHGHGTGVAGIVGAVGNNNLGTVGVNWNVTLVPLLIGPDGGATEAIMIAAVTHATNFWGTVNEIQIINMSFSGYGRLTSLRTAINNYPGLFVWSAGNNPIDVDTRIPDYGSFNLPNLIAVGAIDSNGQKSQFSAYSSSGEHVHVFAPGNTGYTTSLNDGYQDFNGTSMAAPHAAGVAALLLSQEPWRTATELKDLITENYDPITIETPMGTQVVKRLNAFRALEGLIPLEYDLGMVSISGPNSTSQNTPATISVTVRNRGESPASGYTINLKQIDNPTPLTTSEGITLLPGETHIYEIIWTPILIGQFQIYAEIDWILDEKPENNETRTINIMVYPLGETPYQRPSNWGTPLAGTEDNPFLISSLSNLRWLSEVSEDWWIDENTLVHFKQTSDIDATETIFWNDEAGFSPIGHQTTPTQPKYFVGVYDGDGFLIKNLYINYGIAGLFSRLQNLSIIKNLGLININYWGQVSGGIAAYANMSSIWNCYATGSISGSELWIGGIAGYITTLSSIIHCYTNLHIQGISSNNGGIAGYANDSIIINCYSTSVVNNTYYDFSSGILGYQINSNLNNNLWNKEVSGLEHATGNSGTPPTNYGLSSFEMKQIESYLNVGWNFDTIWEHDLDKNYGYAYLQALPDVPISYCPRSLEVEQVGSYVSLSWVAPMPGSTGTLTRYKIYKDGFVIAETLGLSFQDHEVEIGIEYEYYVTAVYVSPNGETAASNVVSILVVELPVFEPPTNLLAIAGDTVVYLSWEAPVVMDNGEWMMENDSLVILRNEESKLSTINYQLSTSSRLLSSYIIERKIEEIGNWEPILQTADLETLVWMDTDLTNGTDYYYRVIAIYTDPDGISEPSEVAGPVTPIASAIKESDIPIMTSLIGNYPNPFNPETTIKLSLTIESHLRVDIYNIKGQKVTTLLDEVKKPGYYSIVWKGTDNNGHQVSSGIYFYKMQTDEYISIKKMILMK